MGKLQIALIGLLLFAGFSSCSSDRFDPVTITNRIDSMEWNSNIYWIFGDASYFLGVQRAPVGGFKLQKEVENWSADGINHVISALEETEAQLIGLGEERALCEEAGISFHSYPIPDFSYPGDPSETNDFIELFLPSLLNGERVIMHCRGGLGRSPLLAACTLIKMGYSAEEAMETISLRRESETPETEDQKAFIKNFELLYGEN